MSRMPSTLAGTVDAIRSMRIRGADAIGVAGARALARHVQALDGPPSRILAGARRAARTLDAARPTAVTLHNSLGWVLDALRGEPSASAMRRAAADAAKMVSMEVAASRAAIALAGARQVPDGGVVLTHCHSTAVVAILKAAQDSGKTVEAIATETRPFRQGLRTVRELASAGVQAALVVDSAVSHILATRDVDLALVGADTVAADGSLFNKIGTSGVAALARHHDVPFHAAAGLPKFTRLGPDDVPIEERSADEVARPREVPRGVRILNPVFDRTPPSLVTAFVTEQGLASPRQAVRRNLKGLPPEEAWR